MTKKGKNMEHTIKTAEHYLNLNPTSDLFSKYLDSDNYEMLFEDDDISLLTNETTMEIYQ